MEPAAVAKLPLPLTVPGACKGIHGTTWRWEHEERLFMVHGLVCASVGWAWLLARAGFGLDHSLVLNLQAVLKTKVFCRKCLLSVGCPISGQLIKHE